MRRLISLVLVLVAQGVLAGAHVSADVQATAEVHATDTPAATPMAVTEPAVKVIGEAVAYGQQDGRELRGYLARPAGAGPLPGLIVIHEWWGLNDNIRGVAERLAAEGYTALAVDLYGGSSASTPKDAMQLMNGLQNDMAAGIDNLRQALAYLEGPRGSGKVGVIGWCLGGQWSLRASVAMPAQIDATVIYYGSVISDEEQLAPLQMPILGNFAENDPLIPLDKLQAFEDTLKRLGKQVDIKVYANAKHAFSNPSGTAYNPEAAADAWERSTSFLRSHLQ